MAVVLLTPLLVGIVVHYPVQESRKVLRFKVTPIHVRNQIYVLLPILGIKLCISMKQWIVLCLCHGSVQLGFLGIILHYDPGI